MDSELVHSAAARCAAPARVAFSFLADDSRLGEWALGCWGAVEAGDGLVRGRSLLDGSETFVRLVPHEPTLGVDYEVGRDPARLERRIAARAVPGKDVGLDPAHCLLVLSAWRPATMENDRWYQLIAAHAAEVLILRRCVEREVEVADG
ncbi:MAG TPA: hypothetical protein VNJ46_05445 [Gaiellaceae bacterium]|nr:hypothetical protein [Gaiellaceae bacterium]